MDAQLKRGMLEACVLAVLVKGDSYAYQIVRELTPYIELSESTLYPILKRLESGGCLCVYSVEHNGRLRKYYQITPEGRARIQSFLEEWDGVQRVYQFIKGVVQP